MHLIYEIGRQRVWFHIVLKRWVEGGETKVHLSSTEYSTKAGWKKTSSTVTELSNYFLETLLNGGLSRTFNGREAWPRTFKKGPLPGPILNKL